MHGLEAPLDRARRSVREAEALLAEQAMVVDHLQESPFPEIAAIAEKLLQRCKESLQQAQDHLSRMEEDTLRHSLRLTTIVVGTVVATLL